MKNFSKKAIISIISIIVIIVTALTGFLHIKEQNELEKASIAAGYRLNNIIVSIKPEKFDYEKNYSPAFFSKELVKSVKPVGNPKDGKANSEWVQVYVLELKEPSIENVDKLISIVSQNEDVLSADKNDIATIKLPTD